MRYGEKEIRDFDITLPEHYWKNQHKKRYIIHIELLSLCVCVLDLAIQTLPRLP